MVASKDQVLLRTKDISVIILIVTLLGVIGTQFKKIYRWEQAADKVEQMEPRLRNTEQIGTVVTTQLTEISKQLDDIKWQMRRMQNNGRNP